MDNDTLKQLIRNKQIIDFETSVQDFDHGLRLVLRDFETGEMGILAVEPVQVALPDEWVLDYSYQAISEELGPPLEECLITDLKTKVGPDYERGEVPFLFD